MDSDFFSLYFTFLEVYNIQYYTKDTMRNPKPIKVVDPDGQRYLIEKPDTPDFAPPKDLPEVLRYDPTGTRSIATTSAGRLSDYSYFITILNFIF